MQIKIQIDKSTVKNERQPSFSVIEFVYKSLPTRDSSAEEEEARLILGENSLNLRVNSVILRLSCVVLQYVLSVF